MPRDRHPDDLEWDGGTWQDPRDYWGTPEEEAEP